MTAAISRPSSSTRSNSPIGTASPRASAESRKRGKLRGLGIGSYLEVTAPPSKEMGGIRFEADGTVTIITGTLDYGQGHATPFAQVLIEPARHPVRAHPPAAGRQRRADRRRRHRRLALGMAASAMAIVEAVAKVIEQGKQIAAHRARSRGRRHRVRRRPLHHRRHRPLDRHHGARRASCAPA